MYLLLNVAQKKKLVTQCAKNHWAIRFRNWLISMSPS